ncbi:MAG: hypothetical protein N3D12_05915 [Candidatus Methanomethyliaceae archaeon]|nr:hypothetical protein [Candidatus Methanomethyliaceae archaeon]
MSNGVARIYDAVLAIIILMTSLIVTLGHANSFAAAGSTQELSELASNLLVYLERKGLLSSMVFAQEYERLESLVSNILPSGLGFRISVYTCDWRPIWSVDHQFKSGRGSSALMFLSGYYGKPDPRIVVLTITR